MERIKKQLKDRFSEIWADPCGVFTLFGFVFTSLCGTLLHFLPDLVQNNFIYLFAPVNESIWEHLKLLFYPALIFMPAEYFAYGKDTAGFISAKLRGILAGMAVIVGVHYLYSGIIGHNISWIDISLFFVGAATAYILPYLAIKRGKSREFSTRGGALGFVFIILLFTIFTFYTPKLGIFIDPQTGTYGIQ